MKRRFVLGIVMAALLPTCLVAQSPAQRLVAAAGQEQSVMADSPAAAAMVITVRATGAELPPGTGAPTTAPAVGADLHTAACNPCNCCGDGDERTGIRGLIRSVRAWLRDFHPTV